VAEYKNSDGKMRAK